MYVAAQRVVGREGREGINTFLYLHGETWESPASFLPEQRPGELAHQHVEVQPPGNRVRSYLDVLAPDGASVSELTTACVWLVTEYAPPRLPAVATSGRCWFRFDMEASLSPAWKMELQELSRSCLAALAAGQTT
jgi:hypothetical protein